jgi:hypothetical protein
MTKVSMSASCETASGRTSRYPVSSQTPLQPPSDELIPRRQRLLRLKPGGSRPICVASVIDVENDNLELVVVDAVSDPVLPAPRPPQARERGTERNSDLSGPFGQRSRDELPRREGGRRRK